MIGMRLFVLTAITLLAFAGCAEGPFWKAGQYLPWVQAKWAAEEEIAETVHSKKRDLRQLARQASRMSEAEKEQAVVQLTNFIQNEKIIQLRVHALHALGEINNQSAENQILQSLKDPEAEVRIAAVQALARRRTSSAGQELVRIIRSDTDKDVRGTAIRALASYPGDPTVDVLAEVLQEPEPALQYAAMQSLDAVTGSDIGINVTEWKKQLANRRAPGPTVR